jgi:glycosyltransferase involved in cell wall biosynthesis
LLPAAGADSRETDMRIAYLTTEYPALSHSFIRREIVAMEALGHQVARFSIRSAGRLRSAEDRAEAERTRFILAQGPVALAGAVLAQLMRAPGRWLGAFGCVLAMWRRGDRGLVAHLAWLAEACWLVPVLRRERVHHLHAHFGTNPAAVARLVRRLGGPPYSFTVHGPDEFDRPAALDLRGKVAEAQAAIAISDYGRAQLMRWSALADWPRLHVVRCAIGEEFRIADPVPIPQAPALVAVARLAEQKGLPLLIEAAGQVAATHPGFTLRIVGDGPLRPVLEQRIATLGLGAQVTLVGPLDGAGVRDAMLAARAFVLPSFAEGLPVVIMEALALRRPVIASAIAGTPELVGPDCGWLVPAGAVDALADAMRQALDAPTDRLATMGEAGRARVLAAHDAATNARQLAGLFG